MCHIPAVYTNGQEKGEISQFWSITRDNAWWATWQIAVIKTGKGLKYKKGINVAGGEKITNAVIILSSNKDRRQRWMAYIPEKSYFHWILKCNINPISGNFGKIGSVGGIHFEVRQLFIYHQLCPILPFT